MTYSSYHPTIIDSPPTPRSPTPVMVLMTRMTGTAPVIVGRVVAIPSPCIALAIPVTMTTGATRPAATARI
ncbi:hypothetical protein M378DRAFT_166871 [Amanita muscaria Koide BX008]|uniref:Uncharacterized protein n=1 Tax=Amanita muscaria (strain Koide BX008) TaxID=946122 RepID=A0A0C2SEF2_AMAMK|nr:hypothetical protein M378DRAFT_166871 [Amanita muscaria Koide BX008]